jgi:hypothetical protein
VEDVRCGPRWSGVAIWGRGLIRFRGGNGNADLGKFHCLSFWKLTKRLRKKDTKRTQRLSLSKHNKPKNNNTVHPSLLQNPDSYETDPDPSSTTHRTHAHSSSSGTLAQYALMIDAGSTGSRIHLQFEQLWPFPRIRIRSIQNDTTWPILFRGQPRRGCAELGRPLGRSCPRRAQGHARVYTADS